MLRFSALLLAIAVAGCGAAPSTPTPDAVEAEARAFMAGYAADLLSGDPDAIAARYSRRGAHFVFPGQQELQPYDSIVRTYREEWRGPEAFEWQDLSYEVVGDDAVAVVGAFRWESADDRGVLGSYTALLVREDGELRIRLENESFDDLPPPECAAQEEPCDLPLEGTARERYTGEYEVAGREGRARVYDEDGRLMIQPPGMPPMRLLHQGDHAFRVEDAPGIRVMFDGGGDRAMSFVTFGGLLYARGARPR